MAQEDRSAGASNPWSRFWFASVEPHGMAAYRVLMGAYLLAYFLRYLPDVELLFSRDGVYVPVAIPDIAPPPLAAWLIYLTFLGAIVLFTVGYRTAFLTPAVLGLYAYHWLLNLAVKDASYDRLIIILLAISCLGELDGAWALGRRRGNAGGEPPRIRAWAGRLLAFQIAALYFGSGAWKLMRSPWRTGKMLEMTFIGPWATPAAFWFANLDPPRWFWDALTWGVVALEMALGIALYLRPVRKLAMLLGLLFHLGIWLFLRVPEFLVCVTVYPLFLDPPEVKRAAERLLARFAR